MKWLIIWVRAFLISTAKNVPHNEQYIRVAYLWDTTIIGRIHYPTSVPPFSPHALGPARARGSFGVVRLATMRPNRVFKFGTWSRTLFIQRPWSLLQEILRARWAATCLRQYKHACQRWSRTVSLLCLAHPLARIWRWPRRWLRRAVNPVQTFGNSTCTLPFNQWFRVTGQSLIRRQSWLWALVLQVRRYKVCS